MKRILIFSWFVLASVQSFGWGSHGHKIVANLAKLALSPEKQIIDSVQYYLGKMTWEEAAVWMDEIKSDNSYDALKPAHYVNVERDATYVKTKDPNIINELEMVLEILNEKGSRNKEKTAMALRELFHLVGDIHMPLHCGYGSDRGGNNYPVTYAGKSTDLHKLWDSEIIYEEKIGLKEVSLAANQISTADKADIQKIDILKWMNEGREYLTFIYDFQKSKITSEYSTEAKIVIEKQLAKAAIRLATVLRKTFKR